MSHTSTKNLAYVQAALTRAQVDRMEDGAWFATIPGFPGLWATGATEKSARTSLRSVLIGWLIVHCEQRQNPFPPLN